MSYKNKHETQNPGEKIIADLGMAVMSLAAVASLVELHDVRAARLAPTAETGYKAIVESVENKVEELIRREKEETAHSIVSYGQTMRSHAVSGKA